MANRHRQNFRNRNFPTRQEGRHELDKVILIACEGVATEPNYIKDLVRYRRTMLGECKNIQIVFTSHTHSDPFGVLNDLLSDQSYRDADERWIIIDRDPEENFGKGAAGHTEENFQQAITTAKKLGINVAWSNPCFELWIVLHFLFRDTSVSRQDVQHKALDLLKKNGILASNDKVNNMKACTNLYEKLYAQLNTAIENAKKLAVNNKDNFENPCTLIYELLGQLK